MQRVTGIGGIFFKAENPPALQEWYGKHLGIKADPQAGVISSGGTRTIPASRDGRCGRSSRRARNTLVRAIGKAIEVELWEPAKGCWCSGGLMPPFGGGFKPPGDLKLL